MLYEVITRTFAEIEGEKPETLAGWRRLFERAGLVQINTLDKSGVKGRWMQESRKQLSYNFV